MAWPSIAAGSLPEPALSTTLAPATGEFADATAPTIGVAGVSVFVDLVLSLPEGVVAGVLAPTTVPVFDAGISDLAGVIFFVQPQTNITMLVIVNNFFISVFII
jgi:hypothetical protein